MTEKETPSVSEIINTFSTDKTADKIASLLKRFPNSPIKPTAEKYLSQPYLEVNLGALNVLAETYSRGINCNFGVVLSKAIYKLAKHALAASPEKDVYDAYLFCAGNSLNSWLLGLNGLGQYQDSVRAGEEGLKWLEKNLYKESQKHQCMLRLNMIEAYIGLAHANNSQPNEFFLIRAQELLNETKIAISLTIIGWCIASVRAELKFKAVQFFSKLYKVYQSTLEQLENKYNQLIQDATNLPISPEKKTEQEQEQFDREISQNLNVLKEGLKNIKEINPELVDHFKSITESLETLKQQSSANSTSAEEQAIADQDLMDRLSDFLSAYNLNKDYNEAQKIQLQKKIRNACLIFADPDKGQDQKLIQNSQNKLQEARSFARQNNFIEDENDALWGLYLCYSRSQQEDRAIDALQSLRQNLESLRSQISDPMKCAGVFQKFPYLFASLCQLLCRAGRSEELLNAMEGAKGRVLADVLTESQGEVIEDSTFTETVKYLPELIKPAAAILTAVAAKQLKQK